MGNKTGMVKIFLILFLSRIAILILPILLWQLSGKTGLTWNWWDAPHFLYIAQNGYTNIGDEANFIVFSPLYPLAIKFVDPIFVSILSFSIAGVLFYNIVAKIWNKEVAKKALFLLAIFPTSYFFTAPYTESLFWLMAMAAMYFAYKKYWILAGTFVGLSFLTRMPGIIILPVIWIIIWQTKSLKIKNIILVTLPVIFCVGMYLYLNYSVYTDPLAFQKILHGHWQKTFAFPWQSVYSSWQATRGGIRDDYALQIGFWEAIPATISLILIPFVWKYLKNPAWGLWYTLSVILITSTSFLLSTPRYLLTIPPLIVFLAIISQKYKWFYFVWIFISSGLLAYFSMRFVTGQWSF